MFKTGFKLFIFTFSLAKVNCEPSFERIPLGDQNISSILKNNKIYIDKTRFALEIIKSRSNFFISRPSKFGKSLFLDTLREILEGNKDLFKNCDISKMNYAWDKHTVLYFDFSVPVSQRTTLLKQELKSKLTKMAKSYGVSIHGHTPSSLLKSLVEQLSAKIHKKKTRIVILIDGYDSQIVNNLEDPILTKSNMDTVKYFLTTAKSLDNHIAFVIVTGVVKFSLLLHSGVGPDHLVDISMDEKYSALAGFTEKEIKSHYKEFIQYMAEIRSNPEKKVTEEEILIELRCWYSGYNFSEHPNASDLVYNPWSVMSYFKNIRPQSYLSEISTPSYLVKLISKYPECLPQLKMLRNERKIFACKETLSTDFDLDYINPIALLFQTGFLTISHYDEEEDQYTLEIPNKETEESFLEILNQFTKVIS